MESYLDAILLYNVSKTVHLGLGFGFFSGELF